MGVECNIPPISYCISSRRYPRMNIYEITPDRECYQRSIIQASSVIRIDLSTRKTKGNIVTCTQEYIYGLCLKYLHFILSFLSLEKRSRFGLSLPSTLHPPSPLQSPLNSFQSRSMFAQGSFKILVVFGSLDWVDFTTFPQRRIS